MIYNSYLLLFPSKKQTANIRILFDKNKRFRISDFGVRGIDQFSHRVGNKKQIITVNYKL